MSLLDTQTSPKELRQVPFLPDMCSLQAVFLLVVLGELLALALTLADSSLLHFDWEQLGLRSFLIQWIVLLSAALLCPMRFWLSTLKPSVAGLLSYSLVLLVTAVCTQVGIWVLTIDNPDSKYLLFSNVLLSMMFGGVVLRYLYVQQQWSNQQKAELQARIQALQSRIQPHFLFNSMNSIASLIASDPDTAERLVVDLCDLFRSSLIEPARVPLINELNLCRQYLDIETVRLGARLQIDWQIAPDLEAQMTEWFIPSLLLQPLLENAIQHGIQPRLEGGCVQISLAMEDLAKKYLTIKVTNPLPQASTSPVTGAGNRMALENIEHRLQAYYGAEAYFKVGIEDGCFVAVVRYPQH